MSRHIDKKVEFTPLGTRINDNVGRHGHEPFAQKKADRAQKMMEQAGFPGLPKNKNKTS